MASYTGTVEKAYSPSAKSGYRKFFFEILTADKEALKGMALASTESLAALTKGNTVELEATLRGGWLNAIKSIRVLQEHKILEITETLQIGHVGHSKPTRFGRGFYARVGDDWFVIPVTVAAEYFGIENPDNVWDYPGRGRGELVASVKRNGSTVVTKIHSWTPTIKLAHLVAPFAEVYWYTDTIAVRWHGHMLQIPVDKLPFDYDPTMGREYRRMQATLDIAVRLEAHSEGMNRVSWTVVDCEIEQDGDMANLVRTLIWNKKIQIATAAVRAELRELTSRGVVVDLTKIVDLFLNQGLDKANARTYAETEWEHGYDVRYLKALQALGNGNAWRVEDGYLIEVGDCIVWERCIKGAATYILPLNPNPDTIGELSRDEWISVLGRVLPGTNKMDLRYGAVGQTLSGTVEGVGFAIHTETDDGNFDGWLNSVKGAVNAEQTAADETADLPSLDDILALCA